MMKKNSRILIIAAALIGAAACVQAFTFPSLRPQAQVKTDYLFEISLAFDQTALERATPEAIEQARSETPAILRNIAESLGEEHLTLNANTAGFLMHVPADENLGFFLKSFTPLFLFNTRAELRLVREDNAKAVEALLANPPRGYAAAQSARGQKGLIITSTNPAPLFLEEASDKTETGQTFYIPYFLEDAALLTGQDIRNATVQKSAQHSTISLRFKEASALQTITADYKPFGSRNRNSSEGRRLAFVLGTCVVSAPIIQTEIAGGQAEIAGHFSLDDARRIAASFNAATLPIPLSITGSPQMVPKPRRAAPSQNSDVQDAVSLTVEIDAERLSADIRASEGGNLLTDAEVKARIEKIMEDAAKRTLEVLRNRLTAIDIENLVITTGKNHQFLIRFTNATANQIQAAEACLKSAGHLTFRLVHKNNAQEISKLLSSNTPIEGYIRDVTRDGQRCLVRDESYTELIKDPAYPARLGQTGVPSTAYELMFERAKEKTASGKTAYIPYFIQRSVLLTGEKVARAQVQQSAQGKIAVSITFKTPKEFAKITADYRPGGARNRNSSEGRRLAIILDDLIYSAPAIQCEIPNGQVEITGNFSHKEALVLQSALNAGSLPAPIKILAETNEPPESK